MVWLGSVPLLDVLMPKNTADPPEIVAKSAVKVQRLELFL